MPTEEKVRYTRYDNTPIGPLWLSAEGDSVSGIRMEGQSRFPILTGKRLSAPGRDSVLRHAADWLDRYFAGEKPEIGEIKLVLSGSEFRRAVWQALCRIPYGETVTYGEIAAKLAVQLSKPRLSAQAVGNAVGHNAIGIVIPCHRVIGSGGNLTGYAGGLEKKLFLLSHEGVETERLRMPKRQR